ncbi:hypothetical protein ACH5RR_019124 [Cinchona calisaya]|uniref:F-box associated domain-containing protein n=1 Tax=Cinchona calisaya TaxID=153742 RepID=A0ABD2ZRJ7_9GENT
MTSEDFRDLQLPANACADTFVIPRVDVLGESLAFISSSSFGRTELAKIEIWVMEEYGIVEEPGRKSIRLDLVWVFIWLVGRMEEWDFRVLVYKESLVSIKKKSAVEEPTSTKSVAAADDDQALRIFHQ